MQLSLILPLHNLAPCMDSLMDGIAAQMQQLPAELLVVDAASTDAGMAAAVQAMHARGLRGYAVQNGDATVPAALCTGLRQAQGAYLRFLLPEKLYTGGLAAMLQTARRNSAQLVYPCTNEEQVRRASRKLPGTGLDGSACLLQLLAGELRIDLGAVLLQRAFLLQKRLAFAQGDAWQQAFLYDCLLLGKPAQAPVILRDSCLQPCAAPAPEGLRAFSGAQALLRLLARVQAAGIGGGALEAQLLQQALPAAVLDAVDALLLRGVSRAQARSLLHRGGYAPYLRAGKRTPLPLRKRLALWRFAPWSYQPEKARA